MSYRKLADGLAHLIEQAEDKTSVDATLLVQMMFEDADRHYASAKVIGEKSLLLVVGLRSEVLEPFPMFTRTTGEYSPCDILALVPAIALRASEEQKDGSCFMIENDDGHTRLVMGFEGEDILTVARSATRFIDRWTNWRDVLLNILEKEALFDIDWREFLAGETGYMTMHWYRPLSIQTRELALNRVTMAAKALLQSVLSKRLMEKPLVQKLIKWLESLRPQPIVVGITPVPMESEA